MMLEGLPRERRRLPQSSGDRVLRNQAPDGLLQKHCMVQSIERDIKSALKRKLFLTLGPAR